MLRLNENDPLDRMLLQELKGEPVLFDTWLEAMAELAEEPDCAQILRERGLCAKNVLEKAEHCRADFHARLSSFGLSPEKPFPLCAGLFSLARKDQSPQLLRLYCEILSDPGFLLGEDPEPDFDENKGDDEEQTILQYLSFCREYDKVQKNSRCARNCPRNFHGQQKFATHSLWIAIRSGAMKLPNALRRYLSFPQRGTAMFCWETCQTTFKLRPPRLS